KNVPLEAFTAVWGNSDATYFVTAQGSIYESRNGELKRVFHKDDLYLHAIAGSQRAGIVAGGTSGITVLRKRAEWTGTEQDAQTQFETSSMGSDGTLFVTGYANGGGGFVRSRRPGQVWADRTAPAGYVETIWAADNDHAFGLNYDGLHRLVGSTWD